MAEKGLKCSINRSGCKNEARYVCHHCGRPLCSGPNCCLWGWDPVFAGSPIAHHCPECDHIQGPGQLAREMINQSNRFFEHLSRKTRHLKKRLKARVEQRRKRSKDESE